MCDITLFKADSLFVDAASGDVYTVQVNTACGFFVYSLVLALFPSGFAEILYLTEFNFLDSGTVSISSCAILGTITPFNL